MNLNLIGMYIVLTKSFQNHVGFRANKENCLEKDDWEKNIGFCLGVLLCTYYLLVEHWVPKIGLLLPNTPDPLYLFYS